MGLDERGDIAVLELIVYTPILVTSGILIFRHGLGRNAGWIYLLILSIIRIVGGSVHLASELGDSNNTTLKIVFGILESAGLSPLLLATLGLLRTVAQRAFEGQITRLLHAFGLISGIALALSITGGTQLANADGDQSKLDSASKLRHIGAILFLVLYVLVVIMHGIFWIRRHEIMKNRRKLLLGISATLPFLGVRVIYSVLASYAPLDPNDKGGLANFNSSTGSWYIYLMMDVLSELFVVLIYTFVGITVPLDEDYKSTKMERWEDEEDRQTMLP
ncbi:hypothetical protein QCA50_001420 [Cerrena zonata]|uniref:DUF7702 domain-containing protein n=1 Tax=Cerrena zonata TaxID=2478898 RepID=A0AAW0GX25_9APHY